MMGSLIEDKKAYKGRKIKYWTDDGFRVISEPGDLTRYIYHVKKSSTPGRFLVSWHENGFNYPAYLDMSKTAPLTDEALRALAKEKECNPNTLAEVYAACCQISEMKDF